MDFNDENSHQAINEAYKIWKKNVPFLYNIQQTYQLPSCSQTIDILPQTYLQDAWEINRVVLGSNSLVKNYIIIMGVKLPTEDSLVDFTNYKQQKNADPNLATMGQQQLNVLVQYPQNGQILRTRAFKGQSQQLLAANIGGQNYQYFIYDLSLEPEVIESRKIVLDGHDCEGFGLDWHPSESNFLATAAYDKKMCIWNLGKESKETKKPEMTLMNESGVQDVQWCKKNPNILGCACQQKSINIWDIRESQRPAISKIGHNGEVYSLSFNPFSEYLLLSGSEDQDINLWDTRNMNKKIHTFIGHNDSVSKVKWSQQNPYQFTSCSFDRRVVVWNMKGLNESKQANNEIMFIHGGHRTKVTDFCWNSKNKVCCSTEENNIAHVWQMTERIQEQ